MIRAGIIGGAGYTAGELIRLLVHHPECDIAFVNSESNAGNPVQAVHEGLIGDTDLVFTSELPLDSVDVLFMCGAHGKSAAFWDGHPCPEGLKVIDLAQDFRDESCGYVYGLPEWQRDRIALADKVANPGCFATAVQLALLPLASKGLLKDGACGTAITGSTGAGVKPSATTHFSWRNNNISSYKVFEHQHLKEINRNLGILAGGAAGQVNFLPVRGDFSRGIFAAMHIETLIDIEEATSLFREFYSDAAFTFVASKPVDLKEVVNTNKCVISLEKHENRLVVTSVIDNLLKGAVGQAVQNMNIMFALPENAGLKLKASAF